MFSQGVDPRLDFSDINHIRDVYFRCTGMEVHPRHPYAGELVFTAFSGSHQDAINKGLKAMERSRSPHWNVPYLPIDPKDVGRSYESIIRINSQSGKGGVAYILEKDWGIRIPKEMQRDFAKVVQSRTEKTGKELSSVDIHKCFQEEYLEGVGPYVLSPCVIHTGDGGKNDTTVSTMIRNDQTETRIEAKGNGPVDAFVNGIREGFGISLDVVMYEEHARSKGAGADAIAYIGIKEGFGPISFGAGVDANISQASLRAVISALNRGHAWRKEGSMPASKNSDLS
jgi:2-isopropylmalate synthase